MPAGVVLLVGLLASVGLVSVLRREQRDTAEQVMDERTLLAQRVVAAEVRRYLDLLRTVAAAVGAYDRLTRAKYLAATVPLTRAQLVGATSVAFVVPVGAGRVAAMEAFWQGRGAAGLRFQPVGSGAEHLFTVFIQPLDAAAAPAAGRDLSQSAQPTAALLQARKSGAAAVSNTYVLFRDQSLPAPQQQLSFVFAAPVYGPAAGGQRPFRGWVTMGLRGRTFIGSTLHDVIGSTLDVSLWAGNSDGTQVEVAALARRPGTDLHRQATIDVAGRHWTLRTAAATGTVAGVAALPLLAGGAGTLLSLLLAGLVLVLATGRARAQDAVTVATAGLRAAERDARRQAGLFTAVIDSIRDGVTVVDERGVHLLRNPAADALVPLHPESRGPDDWQTHYGIYHPDGTTPFRTADQPLVLALAGESVDDVEMLVRNPDRPVLLSVSSRPLLAGAGQAGAVAVFRDITAEHEHQAELADANRKLADANQELEAFSYSVSHDLRVPLRVIDGYASMLAEDYGGDLPADAAGYLTRIQQAVARMAALIDDLLAFAQLSRQQLSTRPVDPADVARAAAAELTEQPAGRNLTITIADLPAASADAALLKQVYVNLLSNAIKFSRGRDPAIVSVGWHADVGQTVYTVTDNGAGFDPRYTDKLFGVFQRLHRNDEYEGTGVGLALTHRIIRRHGGRIWAESQLGQGATFSFTLPRPPPLDGDPSAHHGHQGADGAVLPSGNKP